VSILNRSMIFEDGLSRSSRRSPFLSATQRTFTRATSGFAQLRLPTTATVSKTNPPSSPRLLSPQAARTISGVVSSEPVETVSRLSRAIHRAAPIIQRVAPIAAAMAPAAAPMLMGFSGGASIASLMGSGLLSKVSRSLGPMLQNVAPIITESFEANPLFSAAQAALPLILRAAPAALPAPMALATMAVQASHEEDTGDEDTGDEDTDDEGDEE
jgi:hypothetical protein